MNENEQPSEQPARLIISDEDGNECGPGFGNGQGEPLWYTEESGPGFGNGQGVPPWMEQCPAVPEPSTYALLACGLAIGFLLRRHK